MVVNNPIAGNCLKYNSFIHAIMLSDKYALQTKTVPDDYIPERRLAYYIPLKTVFYLASPVSMASISSVDFPLASIASRIFFLSAAAFSF